MKQFFKEACVETLNQCIQAEKRGADRIELCADLKHDGLTPSFKLIKQAKEKLGLPIRVMIRPRPGDFVYSQMEIQQMIDSIRQCKNLGVEGVVFGVCSSDNKLDIKRIKSLAIEAKPMKITIHKAIDACEDPFMEMEKLKDVGIDSVLSSGQAPTAKEGYSMLRKMIAGSGQMEIIACGKITDENIAEIDQLIAAPAYHGKRIVGAL